MISLNEYSLKLSTGEEILVSELVLSVLRATPEAMREFARIRHLCAEVTPEEMEEAKIGYDRALLKKLRAGPAGCLQKNVLHVCGLVATCSMVKPSECTTRFLKKGKGKFPSCWTWASEEPMSSEVCDAVVHAWREGRHVIVVA